MQVSVEASSVGVATAAATSTVLEAAVAEDATELVVRVVADEDVAAGAADDDATELDDAAESLEPEQLNTVGPGMGYVVEDESQVMPASVAAYAPGKATRPSLGVVLPPPVIWS